MQPAKEFTLTPVEPGLFDVERTFYEDQKAFLHVLARKKMPKKAPAKGASPEPTATRGDFNGDVLKKLKEAFGEDENIAPEKFKEDKYRTNKFRRAIFTAGNGKKVEVYLSKVEPYDVALIYVSDPGGDKAAARPQDPLLARGLRPRGHERTKKYRGTTEAEAEAEAAVASPTSF